MEPLLIHEAADEQHEQLVGRGVLARSAVEVGRDGLEVARVDSVRDGGDLGRADSEHLRHVDAHVAGAGDHVIGAAHHRPLGGVDMGLGMVLDPALVASVLGGVHGDEPRPLDAPRRPLGRTGHEPVVRVDQIEREAVAQLGGERVHVGVHGVDPAHERARVLRELGFPPTHPHPMHYHPVLIGLGRQPAASAGEDVDLDPVADKVLGELADVAAEAALDHRRVLPGDEQDAHAPGPDPIE